MAKFSKRSKLDHNERKKLLIHFFKGLGSIKSPKEAAQVLSDLMSEQEIDMVAKRLAIARDLLAEKNYQQISRDLKVSFGTIARVNTWLNESGEGLRLVDKRVESRNEGKPRRQPFVIEESLVSFKRHYPSYFWPEKLVQEIVKSADKKQKRQLLAVIKQSRQKTRSLRQLESYLKGRQT